MNCYRLDISSISNTRDLHPDRTDFNMNQPYPVHIDGTPSQLPYTTVATFPTGTFLENIAVRSNGHLLVSDMVSGTI